MHVTARIPHSRGAKRLFGGSEERAHKSGMWLRALLTDDDTAHRWCTDKGMDMRAASEGIFSKGGAVVPDELSDAIVNYRDEAGLCRQLARVLTMNRDTLHVTVRTGNFTSQVTTEGGTTSESDGSWGGITLTAKRISARGRVSVELAEDSPIDFAAFVAEEMGEAFGLVEDDCWLNADGTSTYGGMWGIRSKLIDGAHSAGAIDAQAGHGTFAALDADDLVAVSAALPAYAARNARWLVSKKGKALLFDALAVASGGNTIMSVGERPRPTYLGDEIEISQSMPTVATSLTDAVMLLHGDFRRATLLGDRTGFQLQVLRELYALNGQIGLIGWERVDIVNHGLGDNTTAGAVVGLVGN